MLRARGEPVTLFGEREMERRDRLRALLAKETEGEGEPAVVGGQQQPQEVLVDVAPVAELFYTEGGEELHAVRLRLGGGLAPTGGGCWAEHCGIRHRSLRQDGAPVERGRCVEPPHSLAPLPGVGKAGRPARMTQKTT